MSAYEEDGHVMEGTAGTERAKVEAVADLVAHVRRDGRRQYRPEAKQAIVEQCRRPGVSIAAVALANGLNANVVRRWLVEPRASSAMRAPADLVPVVIRNIPKRAAAAKSMAPEATAIEIDVNGARIRMNAQATAEQIAAVVSALRA
jgi:transposase